MSLAFHVMHKSGVTQWAWQLRISHAHSNRESSRRGILSNFPKHNFFFSSAHQYFQATQTHERLHCSDLCSRAYTLWSRGMHLYIVYGLQVVKDFKEEGDSCLPSAFCESVTCIFLFSPNTQIYNVVFTMLQYTVNRMQPRQLYT